MLQELAVRRRGLCVGGASSRSVGGGRLRVSGVNVFGPFLVNFAKRGAVSMVPRNASVLCSLCRYFGSSYLWCSGRDGSHTNTQVLHSARNTMVARWTGWTWGNKGFRSGR